MLGTVVNVGAILAGGLLGLGMKKGLGERFRTMLDHAMALAVLFVGISGAVGAMLQPQASPVLFIVCLAAGGLVGEWLGIERRLKALGDQLQARLGQGSGLSQGFVAASLLFCVGTMAVLGSLESGTQNRHSILFAKSVIDGIMALVMASTLGVGVLLSAGSVLVYQGALTLLAGQLGPWLTADMLREVTTVGGILIFAIGLNMLGLTRVRVGNFLPALVLPVGHYLLRGLWG